MITVEKLVKSYSHQCVLHGIDMEQQKGEAVVIIGPSGCGKTTFLRCLNQMETLDSGRITIAGITVENNNNQATRADREKQRQLRMRAGMVFQSFNLFPHFTVLRNITEAPMTVKGTPRDDANHQARELLTKVGLAEKADFYPSQLSGGQQQRVAIARALAMEPAVLLCDEITSALDPELVGEVLRVVESLANEGMTLLMVTHEMSFARKVSDRLIFMHQGCVHEMGPPGQLFANPQTPELKQFLSSLHD